VVISGMHSHRLRDRLTRFAAGLSLFLLGLAGAAEPIPAPFQAQAQKLAPILDAARRYAGDNAGNFPRRIDVLAPKYLSAAALSAGAYVDPQTNLRTGWITLPAARLDSPAGTIALASAATAGTPWRIVGRTDGRVEVIPAAAFEASLAAPAPAEKPTATPSTPVPAAAAPAPASPPTPPAAGGAIAAESIDALRPMLGKEVTVEGTVAMQGESKTGTVRYLNFSRDFRKSAALVFMVRKPGGDVFTKEKLGEYVGKKVRVTGKLAEYQGALQIEVGALDQLVIQP
jgi:hypothetical protein